MGGQDFLALLWIYLLQAAVIQVEVQRGSGVPVLHSCGLKLLLLG